MLDLVRITLYAIAAVLIMYAIVWG